MASRLIQVDSVCSFGRARAASTRASMSSRSSSTIDTVDQEIANCNELVSQISLVVGVWNLKLR